jgi:diguanylate cyclase (GGDEF)-like protein/PAS domain S-box-containing protein
VVDSPIDVAVADGQNLSARLSRILGAAALDTLDTAIEECLEQLGRHTDVDVAFAVLVDDDEKVTDDWRWSRPGREVHPPELGSPVRDTFGSGIEFLRLGHPVVVDDLSVIELAPSERSLADLNRLRAILLVPVRIGSTLLGMVGLQVLEQPRHWQSGVLRFTELAAELLVRTVIRTRERGTVAAANARARRIAEHLPDGLLLLDPGGSITFASPAVARATGVDADDLVAMPFAELVHPDDRHAVESIVEREGSGLPVRMRVDGAWQWSELSWQLAHEPDADVPDEVVVSVRNIHDKHLATEVLVRERDHDPLTGLLDRRGLDRALAELSSTGASIIVAFIDVDRFKDINDLEGHDAGDAVLRLVGDALASSVRSRDLVGRVGGDEFCVIADGGRLGDESPATLGARLCETLRAALTERHVTASVGIAGPGPASAAGDLRVAADTAMYEVKRAGGDRYAVAEPGDVPCAGPPRSC